ELEFGFRHCEGKIIAITGSNGKTTTTQLVHHLMITAGMDAALTGNIGFSFAGHIATNPAAWYVVEVSSFQLDNISSFRPNIGILLNITPDHLDRYSYSFDAYALAKWKLAINQTSDDLLIYSMDDDGIANTIQRNLLRADLMGISASEMSDGFVQTIAESSYSLSNKHLQGKHNQLNAACAVEAVLAAGADASLIQTGLDTFVNAPHRLEEIAIVNGVRYINDSKATNVDAVFYGLGAVQAPIIWIAGGLDKGNDYTALEQLVEIKVKGLICLGLDNTKLKTYYGSRIAWIREAGSAQEAIDLANEIAISGDTVLLSPACASFDLFKNYEDRGDQFRLAVEGLIHTN
ncbi:MAG: UDP-N-acetylmuramoyl-L-alanine--D-glutamate ligase, partial [Saprospiraceae bacterium]